MLGITYGPGRQVYYLIAAWCLLSMIAMYAWTHTPLGRIANAVRDNPERAEFVGYDTQRVRYLVMILSAFFAGISGGLSAINFEIVTAENVGAVHSGGVLLATFIGGSGFFFGPVIGAVLYVLFAVALSSLTHAWLLYLGLFFVLIVMFVPGGVASLLMMNVRLVKFGKFRRVWPHLLAVSAMALLAGLGAVIAIEMLYHYTLDAANGTAMRLFGFAVDTAAPTGWAVAALLFAIGALGFWFAKKSFSQVWGEANSEIEELIRRGA